jgi:hypothetical protein
MRFLQSTTVWQISRLDLKPGGAQANAPLRLKDQAR